MTIVEEKAELGDGRAPHAEVGADTVTNRGFNGWG